MKKVLSAILTIAMLMTCVFSTFTMPVSAATTDVTLNASRVKSAISFVEENMPDSAGKRVEVYKILKPYLSTEAGIDTLIDMVEGEKEPIDYIKKAFAALEEKGADIDSLKAEIILALNLVKGIDEEDIVEAFEDFEAFVAETKENGEESEFIDSQDELNEIYEKSPVSSETRNMLFEDHKVGPNAILVIIEKLNNYILLTDDEVGGKDFAVSKVKNYDDSVFENIDAEINGEAIESAEDILEIVVAEANDYFSTSEKETLKVVLGEIGIYEPLKDEETLSPGVPEATKKPSSSLTGGVSGVLIPTETPSIPDGDTYMEEVNDGLSIEVPAAGSISFNDTENYWGANYITQLADKDIFKGYPNGNFEPEWGITREEMAVVLVRVLGVENQLGTATLKGYKDVAEISEWARDYVALTTKLGIFGGYDDGYYRPKRVITREELCAVVIRAMENSGNKVLLNYADRATFAQWSTPYIGKASYHGIVAGYPDGEFKATRQVTRAEAAKIIYNFMQVR